MNEIIRAGEQWEFQDAGLILNEKEGRNFWREGEFVQGRATINGVRVFVVVHSGRAGSSRGSVWSLSLNDNPFLFLSREKALQILDEIRCPNGEYIDAEFDD